MSNEIGLVCGFQYNFVDYSDYCVCLFWFAFLSFLYFISLSLSRALHLLSLLWLLLLSWHRCVLEATIYSPSAQQHWFGLCLYVSYWIVVVGISYLFLYKQQYNKRTVIVHKQPNKNCYCIIILVFSLFTFFFFFLYKKEIRNLFFYSEICFDHIYLFILIIFFFIGLSNKLL